MQNMTFGPFFIIQNKLHRDTGLPRPAGIRGLSGITDKIERVIGVKSETFVLGRVTHCQFIFCEPVF